ATAAGATPRGPSAPRAGPARPGDDARHDGLRVPRLARADLPPPAPPGRAARRTCRLPGSHVLRPHRAVVRAPGPLRPRLDVARRGPRDDVAAVRRRERP